jgi:hypothetical protein
MLESETGFEIVTQLADTGKRLSSHLWSMGPTGKILFSNFSVGLKRSLEVLFNLPIK